MKIPEREIKLKDALIFFLIAWLVCISFFIVKMYSDMKVGAAYNQINQNTQFRLALQQQMQQQQLQQPQQIPQKPEVKNE